MDKKTLFPDEKVIITKYFDVHQDWDVPIPGFFVIASKRKAVSIDEFSDDESQELMDLICRIRKGMREILEINYVYLFQDESTSHKLFYMWILPRYSWMDKFGVKIQSIRPIIEYAKENMCDEKTLGEVRDYARRMREYMKSH